MARMCGVVILLLILCPACMIWTPRWKDGVCREPAADVSARLAEADRQGQQAEDRVGLEAAMAAYERVLRDDPCNYQALATLANESILLGAAYTTRLREKQRCYERVLQLSEQAMDTNPEFHRLVRQGETPWTASRVLGLREMDAMAWWVTAIFYLYKECMSPPAAVANLEWLRRCRLMLERMESVDPSWGGGITWFSLGIYYMALPQGVGGDLDRAATYFARAVEAGPNWLLNRWGRAKYFHNLRQDHVALVADLEWVVRQDLGHADDPHAWSVFIQRDARQLLDTENRGVTRPTGVISYQ